MIEYKFRTGDMIVVNEGCGDHHAIGILTKQTQKYWYYFFDGKICRMKKTRLWETLDTHSASKIKVHYGSSMKRRRKQTKDRTMDLHGTPHKNVDEKLRTFLNWAQPPLYIITGDSSKMQKIVRDLVKEYGWNCYHDIGNYGKLVVLDTADNGTSE